MYFERTFKEEENVYEIVTLDECYDDNVDEDYDDNE
jgi:hypothetical protein